MIKIVENSDKVFKNKNFMWEVGAGSGRWVENESGSDEDTRIRIRPKDPNPYPLPCLLHDHIRTLITLCMTES